MNTLLFLFVLPGLYLTYLEWDFIKKDKPQLIVGRILVLNLPLVVLVNLYFLGGIK